MADGSLKVVMAVFTPGTYGSFTRWAGSPIVALTGEFVGEVRKMDAKAMIREWKELSDKDKAQLRGGIEDGSLTY